MTVLETIFDNNGNFYEQHYDPYRADETSYAHRQLFDSRSYVNFDRKQIELFISANKVSPFSDIVRIYYGMKMDVVTSGSYTANYMWK